MNRILFISLILTACHGSPKPAVVVPPETPSDRVRSDDGGTATSYFEASASEQRECDELARSLACPSGFEPDAEVLQPIHAPAPLCIAKCKRGRSECGPYISRDLGVGLSEVTGEACNGQAIGRVVQRERLSAEHEWVVTYEAFYDGGLLQGSATTRHSNGYLASQGDYLDGDPNGEWRWLSPTGVVLSRGFFDRGTPVGVHEERYPSGQMKMRESFDETGTPHGEFCFWKEDGTPIDCYEMVFGTGTQKHYDASGTLLSAVEMVEGSRHGVTTVYGPEGVERLESYRAGRLHGAQREFDEGCITREIHYRDDVPHGPTYQQSCFPGPPVPTIRGQYCSGEPCGKWVQYDLDGEVSVVTEHAADGTVLTETRYEEGELPERVEYPTP